MVGDVSNSWGAALEGMLQSGDLQLVTSDGALTVHSQVLVLASPDVLAGAVESAKANGAKGVSQNCK